MIKLIDCACGHKSLVQFYEIYLSQYYVFFLSIVAWDEPKVRSVHDHLTASYLSMDVWKRIALITVRGYPCQP